MKIRIDPYKRWSGGAKRLGLRSGILRATIKQVKKHGDFDIIINWGCAERRFHAAYINNPEKVALASNKLRSAKTFRNHGVPQPDYCEDRDTAATWLAEGETIVCRKLLRASAGRGIVLASNEHGTALVNAPLYTKYVKKSTEYRVHIFDGRVIDVQQKKKRQEVANEQVNYQIRNVANGWIYARDGVNAPRCVKDAALAAVTALGLDFGAVDIGYNTKFDQATVYEVNTAPGLEGTTLDFYYEALLEKLPQIAHGMHAKRRTV